MSSLYQTTDGATVRLENNIVVGPESKFHGKEVKTNQDIMEVFGINVMKQPKTSGNTKDTMIMPDGTIVPTKMEDVMSKQPATCAEQYKEICQVLVLWGNKKLNP